MGWVGLLFTLCLACSTLGDLVCESTGHSGCDSTCFLSGEGEGKCIFDEITQVMDCVCNSEDSNSVFEDRNTTEIQLERKETADTSTEEGGATSWIIRNLVFLPIVRSGFLGWFKKLSQPSTYGIDNAANLRIDTNSGTLGAWYIWPQPAGQPRQLTASSTPNLTSLTSQDTLVVYMHGNSASRGFKHRIKLYRLLTNLGYHVLTFDYRGFGDSTKIKLCESSVVEDGVKVLEYVSSMYNDRSPEEKPLVLVWGHSLGTAIATHSLHLWQTRSELEVSGLVLEAPFNTMEDEVKHFKTGRWIANTFKLNATEELARADAEFRSQDYLRLVRAPTLILHAEDDYVVPLRLGEKLYNSAVEAGKVNIQMIKYPKDLRLRHRYIYSAPNITDSIQSVRDRAEAFRAFREQKTVLELESHVVKIEAEKEV